VTSYAYKILINLYRDHLRRAPKTHPLCDTIPDLAPTPEQSVYDRDRLLTLYAAIDTLPETQRIALVMRHLEGCSNPTIAATLGVSVEAVESLTARAKKTLQLLLSMPDY
jgi:RNA polymerase sigma-70 factor (ECF subfamily)